jgi:cytochrome oxidase Cu insertion factor (SCO1/SenC/PrrC family)
LKFTLESKQNQITGGEIMRQWLKINLLLLSLFLLSAPGALAQLSMGSVGPAFSLRDLDNNIVSLADFENKAVLLFFLGYNCPYCRGEDLAALQG